jgi:hypothetical protein
LNFPVQRQLLDRSVERPPLGRLRARFREPTAVMYFFYKGCRIDLSPIKTDTGYLAHAVIQWRPLLQKQGEYAETFVSGPLEAFDTSDAAVMYAIDWAYKWIDEQGD